MYCLVCYCSDGESETISSFHESPQAKYIFQVFILLRRARNFWTELLQLFWRLFVEFNYSVSIVTKLWTGRPGFDSRQGQRFLLFPTASKLALGPTQPRTQWISEALSPGIKRSGCEANQSLPPIAEVKNTWSYTSTPLYVFMPWCLIKHRIVFVAWYRRSVLPLSPKIWRFVLSCHQPNWLSELLIWL
jgi:hypothetical protein